MKSRSIIGFMIKACLPLLTLCFCSCEKQSLSSNSAEFEMHMAKLEKLGINTDIVDEYEDYYIIECDMKFTKEFLDEVDTETDESNSKLKQAHIGNSFKIAFANRYINIFLDDNFATLDLSDEVNAVISAYNSIGSYLIFSRVNNVATADIILAQGNLAASVCAESSFPLNGLPGNEIIFDEGEIGGASHNQNVFLIAHEIGHAIGLRHTNWNQTVQYCTGPEPQNILHPDDPSQTISAVQIAGTPTSDASSVFNKCTCGNSWNGFSNYDKVGIIALYPKLSVSISGSSYSPCYSCGTWSAVVRNAKTTTTSYTWNYSVYRNGTLHSTGGSRSATLSICLPFEATVNISLSVTNGGESANASKTLSQCIALP